MPQLLVVGSTCFSISLAMSFLFSSNSWKVKTPAVFFKVA